MISLTYLLMRRFSVTLPLMAQHHDDRFFSTTRGLVVLLLRREPQTVEQLAASLQLTDNAVRAHLTTLERDGLVRQAGMRRAGRKPAVEYTLTAKAGQYFPKPYGAALRLLLTVLRERHGTAAVEEISREVGRRMAPLERSGHATLRERVDSAVVLLDELGGVAAVEEQDGSLRIRGYHCPLADVVPDSPEICQLTVALLSEAIGTPVQAGCDHSPPRCKFIVGSTAPLVS